MGRPEPCVLFSQTFVHPQLDEYVDEVTFAEPIVITACEFLEQNASSASQAVQLVGATSPPSFALEVFVQCEGETRFRRLCQPFLYSHSSSNVLEVEAVVTNHLVVRGSYRSLSLIIYGNTAEDLGQFNIEFDDNSLNNLVSSAEGKLDDLPLALRSANRTADESLTSLNVLSLPVAAPDISLEVRQFLQLVTKLLELPNAESSDEVVNTIVSAVCSYVLCDSRGEKIDQKNLKMGESIDAEELCVVVRKASRELVQVHQNCLEDGSLDEFTELTFLESEADVATSKELVEMLSQYICFNRSLTDSGNHWLLKTRKIILGLGLALLLCIGRESCFHYVNSGGMEQIADIFSLEIGNSSAIILLLLGVIEQATRHPIGCEGILGWWPREDENIPCGSSKGYSELLKLVLEKPNYGVASLATYVLNRLRIYEITSRYENSVLSILGGLSVVGRVTSATTDMLKIAKSQLKILLKLINLRGPVEDPSLVACASRSLILGQTEGLLSYKSTSSLIGSSTCCFSNWDVDCHLLSLLKERGFLPLSLALLSSPILRSEVGDSTDTFIDIGLTIGEILLSLLTCRTGLMFLLHHSELSAMLVDTLRGTNNINREECVPLRHASILLSKGFVCSPQEIGLIVEMQLRVVNATDRLLTLTPHSEEFLWVLWELCAISRSDCGRQALLVLGHFPEAISILIEALHSVEEPELVSRNNGASPVNLAIFHSAAEIFEVIVTDSTASSLGSWIGHAIGLHKALHSSSPGSNSKDAPTRLLEWIDAGVVYHKNGAVGLLRYSAVLASGGDAPINSTNILVSDFTDVELVVGDASNGSEINVMDNLYKLVSEDGDPLRDSSIAQLTTAIRILAFISGNSTVAAALYDEGATAVIHAIVVKCSSMLEKSSNNLDYLVDEGTECNSSSDLLLERNREQSLVDLLVPSLVLLINLLHKLQEAKEQHRNTKLMHSLLRLHREVSPKLAACSADLSSSYPDSALGFGAVCHLLVSALACWPLYGWTPGLFHSLLANVQATSLGALGPKETCSLFCLLNDLFPEEVIWLWDNGMPLLSALRTLAVGTLLGPVKERQVNWYLEPLRREKLIIQLSPYLDKIAQIIQHYAISELVVIQDMLRVFITRIAHQKAENVSLLLRPILSYIHDQVADLHCQSDVDAYKVYRYLEFIASVLEHHSTKELLLKEGVVQILTEVLERCFAAIESDVKQILDANSSAKCGFSLISWCHPIFKSFSLLGSSQPSLSFSGRHDLHSSAMSTKDWSLTLPHLFRFCEMLPVGKELLSCLASFKRLGSCNEGRSAFLIFFQHVKNSTDEPQLAKVHENGLVEDCGCREHPFFLGCWKKLLKSIESNDHLSTYAIRAVSSLSEASLCLCFDSKSVNLNAVKAVKCLFGIHTDMNGTNDSQENTSFIQEMVTVLSSRPTDDFLTNVTQDILHQATETAKSLLSLLQKPISSITCDDIMCGKGTLLLTDDVRVSSKKNLMEYVLNEKTDDYLYQQGLGEKFLWECPETLPDRMPQSISGKRKLPSLEGGKRIKGDNLMSETTGQSVFTRGSGPSSVALGPSRRDTFRQRKPNTSRPPSMHVDDYVARERNADGVTSSNVIAVQRVGSTGGRPPSIHVDEFMARQRERQNPTAAVVGEPSTLAKNGAPVNNAEEKINRSKPLKTDLDDDLQGIDIVFDGEESESDDKLLFPQLDDNLQQPAPVIAEQRSPHSIVEETESDVNGSSQFPRSGTPLMSHVDETQSEISSRMSVLRPEMPLTRELSVSSDKKFFEQSDDIRNVTSVCNSPAFDSVQATSTSGFPVQSPVDSRMSQSNFYVKNSSQNATGSRGIYDRKVPLSQPPLPPIPPPSTIFQTMDAGPGPSSPFVNTSSEPQAPHLAAFQVQSEYLSPFNNKSAQLASSHPVPDSKYSRNSISSPGGSAGQHPPLPPTPPPFASGPYNLPSLKALTSQSSAYTVGGPELLQASIPSMIDTRLGNLSASGSGPISSTPPPLMPHMVFSRTATIPVAFYGSTSGLQQVDNPNILQNLSNSQSSIQAIHQLQPLQPPLQRPPHPPQHLWQPIQSSQSLEQGVSLQQMQIHQLQLLQQSQISPMHAHFPAQQQEPSQSRQQHKQPQGTHQQGDVLQQQQDLGMSLQEYFKDPEAITSLLSNKEELCRLLEQHPKLMQMLQERLGQQ